MKTILTGKSKKDFEIWYSEKWIRSDDFLPVNWVDGLWNAHELYLNALITEWLDKDINILFDRDVMASHYKIWDYREDEPSEPIIVDYTYLDGGLNDALREVFKKINNLYNEG